MRLSALILLAVAVPLSAGLAQTPAAPLPTGHPPVGTAQTAPKPVMNHSGKVIETLDAPPYMYVHVNGEGGDQWLAAPAVKLAAGDTVRWSDSGGLMMTNYHSKTLNRTFDTVYFVAGVETAAGR